ncbi:UDP-N-acetylmuramoyl-tripeptide--D-alanyl-D-alanine ligase [Poseidonocella pacifica]|uniref:UDP-N-acetylmuramoyl-tripeptide--D-alanyl-D-alanine ligase n=1 Tax=Poseidonocella pacifica TaxID=871651 RepID=A0A1I0V2Z8_9RHOB|nr:UDP-N-acetylmuramoyl-tripeptide--D-alanyl-D-alanine ligase [Poseidonocella pacifica]SFA70695.1 UDP-N-acetylmuramoyl-tripeptide--D-alanyl-D-alanine ligase [Poseidonocella pacifica]
MSLWTASEAAEATGGRTTADWACFGISIDTRTIQKDDLFVALTAERDGHDFVADALAKGAAAALVSRRPDGVVEDAPLLFVDDVLDGLVALAKAARARSHARVVAVTGSVGKTSTKEMLRCVLSGQGRTHCAEASYNNHWGVPLTLARMPANTEFAVIEIGMNHPGEIAPLAKLARPHVAVVTTVAPAHIEAFKDLEGVAREKASIVEGLEPGGAAILNGDLAVSSILIEAAERNDKRVISFGEDPSLHHVLTSVGQHDACVVARARAWRSPFVYKVHSPGRHFATNALAVFAVCWVLGLDRALAISDLGQWTPYKGRGVRERIQLDRVETNLFLDLVDDSYNSNPASLRAALEVLSQARVIDGVGRISKGRRVAILGDMKELGELGPALHEEIAGWSPVAEIDKVHAVGPLMRMFYEALPEHQRGLWVESAEDLLKHLHGLVDAGDVVLVKGSLSTGLGRVVDAIRKLGHAPLDMNLEDE